ncbi:MAG: hypothetical protein ACPGJV_14275 [Bacteriovoracaceae bacterium]
MFLNFNKSIFVLCLILCTNVHGHPFHGIGGEYDMRGHNNPLLSLMMENQKKFEYFVQSRIQMKNDSIRYIIPMVEVDLINKLNLDEDGDLKISKSEFNQGYTKIDKWVRKNIFMSSNHNSFFSKVFNTRKDCMISKAEYIETISILGEKVFIADLSFKCPSFSGVEIINHLSKLYRIKTQGIILNIFVQKNDGERFKLKDLSSDEIIKLDKTK